MSLNANVVNNKGPESMIVDSSQQNNPIQLPTDVIPNILRNLPVTELSTLSLVCNNWRTLVDNDDFPNKMIPPPNFNGPQRWTEYTKGDAGKAPSLPRWVFKCMANGGHMLTYIPESVKIKNEDGTETEVPMNSLENIGKLFAYTIHGRKMGFSKKSKQSFIQAVKLQEKGHWVLFSKKAMGMCLDYLGQVRKAEEMGAIMTGSIDTVASLFMEYLRTGELLPVNEKGNSMWIRVNDKIQMLWLGFVDSGLHVDYCVDFYAHDNLAFAPARKFFGL